MTTIAKHRCFILLMIVNNFRSVLGQVATVDTDISITLIGISSVENEVQCVLRDVRDGTTNWVRVNGNFRGYTVSKADTAKGEVMVQRDKMSWTLKLPEAAVKPGSPLFADMARRGISLDDLHIKLHDGKVGIVQLSVQDKPVRTRIVEVSIETANGQFVLRRTSQDKEMGATRKTLSPAFSAIVTDLDVSQIDERLRRLCPKWLTE